jgi:hypothetical protein
MQPETLPRKRKGRPRLPWKRGPRAWDIAQRADAIVEALEASPRRWYSLRRAAKLLDISTQPVREWLDRGYLTGDGPRSQIRKEELSRFVSWLKKRAEPFNWGLHIQRLRAWREWPVHPFCKLARANFWWPKGTGTRTPAALSRLVGCHPSLIIKAIKKNRLSASRRSPRRWEISRRNWLNSFPTTCS